MIFLSVGSELCTISADGILTTLNIATTPSDNTNLECSISLNDTACYQCVGNAHLKNDLQCSCTSNSLYDSESMNCTCDTGYTEANSFCIKYGNYFAPSEISASYSADYKSFVLTFARQVSDSTVLNCAGEVSLPRVLASGACLSAAFMLVD